jgi:hypothetical protein
MYFLHYKLIFKYKKCILIRLISLFHFVCCRYVIVMSDILNIMTSWWLNFFMEIPANFLSTMKKLTTLKIFSTFWSYEKQILLLLAVDKNISPLSNIMTIFERLLYQYSASCEIPYFSTREWRNIFIHC